MAKTASTALSRGTILGIVDEMRKVVSGCGGNPNDATRRVWLNTARRLGGDLSNCEDGDLQNIQLALTSGALSVGLDFHDPDVDGLIDHLLAEQNQRPPVKEGDT